MNQSYPMMHKTAENSEQLRVLLKMLEDLERRNIALCILQQGPWGEETYIPLGAQERTDLVHDLLDIDPDALAEEISRFRAEIAEQRRIHGSRQDEQEVEA